MDKFEKVLALEKLVLEKSDARPVFAWAAQVYEAVVDEAMPGMRTEIRRIDKYKWRVQFLWTIYGRTLGYMRTFDCKDLESLKTAGVTFFAESAIEEILKKFPRSLINL